MKERLLEILLMETDGSIRDLLAETVKIISEFEFPSRRAKHSNMRVCYTVSNILS